MKLPHLRISQPQPGIYAYYDGRVAGYRFDPRPNWVDEGGLGLGIASYTLVEETNAIVYDTGTTPAHGTAIADHLKSLGVEKVRIIYSHWHKDHIAGTAQILQAFPNSPIIANTRTANHLSKNQTRLESGSSWPPIAPLILPTQIFENRKTLTHGQRTIELILHNIHSNDASVLWLPVDRILLAGDTLEDPITYVDEPQDFEHHLNNLQKLKSLNAVKILPCHGAEENIASGGYSSTLIDATLTYTHWLHSLRQNPEHAAKPVHEILTSHFAQGHIQWFEPYADVHAANIKAAMGCLDV